MKVLLINPEFPDTYWSFRHALQFEGKRCAFPPLGLLTVSALLPSSWEQKLIDMNIRPLKPADIEWADKVLVGGMIVQKDGMKEVLRLAKQHGKTTVVGGPYVSTSPEEFPEADVLFVGEAETTIPEFVADLERGQIKRIYQATERPPLSLTPVPNFALADLSQYSSVSIQFSRGCPFSCEFCDIIEIYGRVPRTKSNQQLLAELDAIRKLGYRGTLFIVDDNFIGNKKNVRKMLPELITWQKNHGFPYVLFTEASVNLADDDALLASMSEAGFKRVFLGIETPVEASLIETQKGQNTKRDLLNSVQHIQSYGMEVMAGFILGFDNDPEDIFDRMIAFIRESAIPLAMVGLLSALPDTQLWKRLEREGRLLKESKGSNTEADLNFRTIMDPQRLTAGLRQVQQTIYNYREFYERSLLHLNRTQRGGPEPIPYTRFEGLKALFRVVLTLGIKDSGRREFWRYIIQTVKEYPDRFGDAVRLAGMGYHFNKLAFKNNN